MFFQCCFIKENALHKYWLSITYRCALVLLIVSRKLKEIWRTVIIPATDKVVELVGIVAVLIWWLTHQRHAAQQHRRMNRWE